MPGLLRVLKVLIFVLFLAYIVYPVGGGDWLVRLLAALGIVGVAASLEIARESVRLLREGIRALPLLVDVLGAGQAPSFRALLKSKALHGCTTHGLPIPQLGAGVDEVGEGGLAAF
jgi:hypothetical protein